MTYCCLCWLSWCYRQQTELWQKPVCFFMVKVSFYCGCERMGFRVQEVGIPASNWNICNQPTGAVKVCMTHELLFPTEHGVKVGGTLSISFHLCHTRCWRVSVGSLANWNSELFMYRAKSVADSTATITSLGAPEQGEKGWKLHKNNAGDIGVHRLQCLHTFGMRFWVIKCGRLEISGNKFKYKNLWP